MRNLSALFFILLVLSPAVFADVDNARPVPIVKNIEYIKDDNGKKLISETEYKAVMEADFDAIVAVLSDLEGASALFPNIKESRLLQAVKGFNQRRIKATYEVLGIGRSYSYIENLVIHKDSDDEFLLESIMIRSLDDELNACRGFWNVERMPETPDGRPQSMVRLYSFFDYSKPFFMQNVILKSFTDEEVTTMYECVEKAANSE